MPWWLVVILCALAGVLGFFGGILWIGNAMFKRW